MVWQQGAVAILPWLAISALPRSGLASAKSLHASASSLAPAERIFLPRIVGIAKALELIWTGEVIDAWEAERLGLVSRVVPPENLIADAVALAQRLAQGPPLAISLAKSAVYKGLDLDIYSAFEYAATAESITLTSADHQEGIRAFREKRPPNFQGR